MKATAEYSVCIPSTGLVVTVAASTAEHESPISHVPSRNTCHVCCNRDLQKPTLRCCQHLESAIKAIDNLAIEGDLSLTGALCAVLMDMGISRRQMHRIQHSYHTVEGLIHMHRGLAGLAGIAHIYQEMKDEQTELGGFGVQATCFAGCGAVCTGVVTGGEGKNTNWEFVRMREHEVGTVGSLDVFPSNLNAAKNCLSREPSEDTNAQMQFKLCPISFVG